MKVNWLVVTKKEADLDIAEVTLLSAEEYEAAKDVIPMRDEFWWLRSPCSEGSNRAGFVDDRGRLDFDGVDNEYVGVRPALRIRNLSSSNLSHGDKFELAGHACTVVSDDMALCDEIVGYTCFRKDYKAEDANDFESSDIRAWLECWAAGEGIILPVSELPGDVKGPRELTTEEISMAFAMKEHEYDEQGVRHEIECFFSEDDPDDQELDWFDRKVTVGDLRKLLKNEGAISDIADLSRKYIDKNDVISDMESEMRITAIREMLDDLLE